MSKINKASDEEIAEKVQKGKVQSFGILVERYQERIKRYARKFLFGYEDAEDLSQEVFIKAYRNIQSFDASKKFSSWLYRIAHNEFINVIKKKGREPLMFFNPDIIFPHPLSKNNPEEEINRKEISQILNKSLDKIKAKYREVLVLYYFENLSYREIADILHIPITTVGIRLKRGKEVLKKEL